MENKYSSRKLLREFANKGLIHSGFNQLLQKIDTTCLAEQVVSIFYKSFKKSTFYL